jgi:predicted ribosome-associated RNA-binding protein Tma20
MKRAVNAAGDTTVWNRSVGSDQRYVVLDAVAALDTGGFLLAGGVTESDDPLGKGDVAFVALDAEGQCL